MEDVKELEKQVDYAVKYKELEEQHNKLLGDFDELKGKYDSAVVTAQHLANQVMNFVTPKKEEVVQEQPKDLETIIKNVLGGN